MDDRLVSRLLPYCNNLPTHIRHELVALGLAPEPFPSSHLIHLSMIQERYENPQPMRGADFVQMATQDVLYLLKELEALHDFANEAFAFRAHFVSEESFDESANKLLTFIGQQS